MKLKSRKQFFDMKDNSAPGPNGFRVTFFKNFWETVKGDYNNFLRDFYDEKLDIKRFNYGVITLVPKSKEANNIKQYRPICLLNVDYKGVTKILNNRLVPVAKEVIGPSQTGFVKGRNILEGVVIIHELRSKKKQALILHIDFEKAYDRVQWDFLEKVMKGKGSLNKGSTGLSKQWRAARFVST